jgi:hypothetical protein
MSAVRNRAVSACENRVGWFCWRCRGEEGAAGDALFGQAREGRQIGWTAREYLANVAAALVAGEDIECPAAASGSCRHATQVPRVCGQSEGCLTPRRMWDALAARHELSPLEVLLVQGVYHDWQEQAIARRLGIQKDTVHKYFQRLYKKVGVSDHLLLVQFVLRDLLEPPKR